MVNDVPHHNPGDFTQRLCETLRGRDPAPVNDLAREMDVSPHAIVTACSDDKRLKHDFRSDQRYYISVIGSGNAST